MGDKVKRFATVTPGRDELRGQIAQALCCHGDCIRGEANCWKYTTSGHKKITDAIVAIFDRLAAKPSDEVREAAFLECADIATRYNDCGGDFIAEKLRDAATNFSPTEEPKP